MHYQLNNPTTSKIVDKIIFFFAHLIFVSSLKCSFPWTTTTAKKNRKIPILEIYSIKESLNHKYLLEFIA